MQIKLLWIQPLLEITSITSLSDKVLGLWHQSLPEGAHWEPRIIPADWDSANPRGMSVKLSVIACMSGKDLRRSVTDWDGLWSALNACSPLRLWIHVVVVAGQFCEPRIKGLRQAGAQCNPEFCQLEYIHLIRLWPVLALRDLLVWASLWFTWDRLWFPVALCSTQLSGTAPCVTSAKRKTCCCFSSQSSRKPADGVCAIPVRNHRTCSQPRDSAFLFTCLLQSILLLSMALCRDPEEALQILSWSSCVK